MRLDAISVAWWTEWMTEAIDAHAIDERISEKPL